MNDSPVQAYVTQADGDYIRVKTLDGVLRQPLLDLGFSSGRYADEYIISSSNNHMKATLFAQLKNLDVCFSSGREWCPAEVFQYLKDEGLLSGGFRQIRWTQPGHYIVKNEE